jgi:hypothetical protein
VFFGVLNWVNRTLQIEVVCAVKYEILLENVYNTSSDPNHIEKASKILFTVIPDLGFGEILV